MDFKLLIGRRISEIRRSKNLSQEDLAFKAKIDRTYMSSIERGKRNISLSVAIKISSALEIDIQSLIGEEYEFNLDGKNLSRRDRVPKDK